VGTRDRLSSGAARETDLYVLESALERDRLFLLFDAWAEDFAQAFQHALTVAGLSTDPAMANWRMLDVACGEGLVSMDILERYPQVRIVGFDRDPESIDTANSAFGGSNNVHFYRHDVHQPLPAEFAPGIDGTAGERFDFGLLRFATANFIDGAQALHNVAQALKPGATVFLFDAQADSFDQSHPELSPLWEAALRAWRKFGTYDAGNQHGRLLEGAGFEVVEHVRREYTINAQTPSGRKMLMVMLETLRSLYRLTVELGQEMDPKEYIQRMDRLRANAETFTGIMTFGQTIARKL
jgi:SAM-dependent methyltransferase